MVVSVNSAPEKVEFEKLLGTTLNVLKEEAKKNSRKYLELLGNKLENQVVNILNITSQGTPFEGSIELISGQKFPDIIAKRYYGIEVKTSKQNHWTTTGNSVLEGTRVDNIERIFMLFGKMVQPIDFKCRPYEECLSEVVVTHSPRYAIDMDLPVGKTIFDKIGIPYDELRVQQNPIKPIQDYYRRFLKNGEDIWWLENENNKSNSLIIRIWNNLSLNERNDLMVKGFCFFPEIVSKPSVKFNKFAIWLTTNEGVICPNVRDIYTAGGQGTIEFENITYNQIPKIFIKLHHNRSFIKKVILNTNSSDLSHYWGVSVKENEKLSKWVDLIVKNSRSNIRADFPLERFIVSKF